MSAPRPVWAVAAKLGEGPAWIDGRLWFVDIKSGALHRFNPLSGDKRTFLVGGRPSFVVPTDSGQLLIGDGSALRLFKDHALSALLARIDMPAYNRTNDATVDHKGRLWFGTMDDDETHASGAVHCFDGRRVRAVGGGCTITNGPAISADGRWLYHVDTVGGTITRFDIGQKDNLEQGDIFVTIAPEDGNPDGVTIDSQGCLWVGLWGGWALRRYSPEGKLLTTIALPCANVTKVAFGGEGLCTGFITTARVGLSDEALALQPLAGGLFAFDAPAPGLPLPSVRLVR